MTASLAFHFAVLFLLAAWLGMRRTRPAPRRPFVHAMMPPLSLPTLPDRGAVVDDHEVRPDETVDGQGFEPERGPTNADRAATMNLRVALLSGVLAVLVIFGAAMTWLYVDRNRAVATETAELNAERTRLAELQHHADDLNAQLKTAQANALDPTGYQLIASCVQEAYSDRQLERTLLSESPDIPPDAIVHVTIPNVLRDPKTGKLSLPSSTCDDAVRYLK